MNQRNLSEGETAGAPRVLWLTEATGGGPVWHSSNCPPQLLFVVCFPPEGPSVVTTHTNNPKYLQELQSLQEVVDVTSQRFEAWVGLLHPHARYPTLQDAAHHLL